MTDNRKPAPAAKPQPQLSEEETDKVVGGMMNVGGGGIGGPPRNVQAGDACKETTDTGMLGCPG